MALFSEQDKTKIANAIKQAEAKTSGEIVAVVAPESDNYLYVPVMWAAIVALFVPWPLIYLTGLSLHTIYLTQLVVFLVTFALLFPKSIRIWFVPPSIKKLRSKRRSVEQFLAQDLHATQSRTGVLIFVSLAERYAAILPDTAIDEKVSQETWQELVNVLVAHMGRNEATQGFLETIRSVGSKLEEHFPPNAEEHDDLPNHLIVLETGV